MNQVIMNLNLMELNDGKMQKRIDAKKGVWNSEKSKWNLRNFSIREFDD